MKVSIAVELWRSIIIIGKSFNDLKRKAIVAGKFELAENLAEFEDNISDWVWLLDSKMRVQNANLFEIDLEGLPITELIKELQITETYFDWINYDLEKCLSAIISMEESLIYLRIEVEKENFSSAEFIEIIERIDKKCQFLIDLLTNSLD